MKRVKEEYRELPGEKLAQVCAKAALDTRAHDRRPFYDLEGLWADAKQVTPEC